MTTLLDSISTEDLQKEIEARKKVKEESSKPKQLKNKNFDRLCETCQAYIDAISNNSEIDKEFDKFAFGIALECVFGIGVFRWINERC